MSFCLLDFARDNGFDGHGRFYEDRVPPVVQGDVVARVVIRDDVGQRTLVRGSEGLRRTGPQ